MTLKCYLIFLSDIKINDFDKYSKMILILIEASIFFLPVGEVFHVQAFPLIKQLVIVQAN
jgi:hypothetical protein